MVHFVWPGVKVHLKPVVDQTTNNSNLPENMGLFLVTAGAKVCDPNTLSNQLINQDDEVIQSAVYCG